LLKRLVWSHPVVVALAVSGSHEFLLFLLIDHVSGK